MALQQKEISSQKKQVIEDKKSLNVAEVVDCLDDVKKVDGILEPPKDTKKQGVEQNPSTLSATAVAKKKHAATVTGPEKTTALLEDAVRQNNPDVIRVMSEQAAIDKDVKKAYPSAVNEAVRANNPECVKELAEAGFSVDHADRKQAAPIQIAAREGSVDCAKALIDAGCDLNVMNEANDPPFVEAILSAVQTNDDGVMEVAKLLSDAGCDVDKVGIDGRSALHTAAIESKMQQVQFLINTAKVNVDTPADSVTAKGYTALHMAIQFTEEPDIAQKIIDAGCDIDKLVGEKNEAAIHMAVKAPVSVREQYVQMLVKAGCRLDVQDSLGNTPLHICKRPDLLYFLCKSAGSSAMFVKNNIGRTPLHAAVDNGCDAAVYLMLQQGALPSDTDVAGDSVLHLACRDELADAAERKEAPAIREPDHFTKEVPFSLSNTMIGSGLLQDTFNFLLSKVSDIDMQNNEAETSLHVAIKHNCKKVVEALLDAGADAFNMYDKKGRNAYDCATSGQGTSPEILGLLEQKQSQHRVPFVNAIEMLMKLMRTVKLDPTLSKREKKTFDSAIMVLVNLLKKNLPKDLAMPVEHRSILKRNRGMLVEELVPRSVVEALFADGVFDEDVQAEIDEELGRRKKVEKLLDILQTRGRRAFPSFCMALKATDQAFILQLMQNKVETDIMKSDDAALCADPVQGRPMPNEQREFLRRNRGKLIQQMKMRTSNKMYKKLVSGGVLTNEMVEEIKQESTEERQCERILDILPTRGRSAYPVFCQMMEQEESSSHDSQEVMKTLSTTSSVDDQE